MLVVYRLGGGLAIMLFKPGRHD